VRLELARSTVREFFLDDLPSLVRHANNRNVSIHLRDRFPYPYLDSHGRQFLEHAIASRPVTSWAVAVDGHAVGGIGLMLQTDVERVSAEIGYWLGEPFWGRGIMAEVIGAVTAEAFRRFELTRIFALPFADNVGSIRVLEKAGYVKEGTMPRSTIKCGVIKDQLLYGAYRPER
jgi:[ribosomal protein S5]-alanine N-acetyltransferase